MLQFESYQKGDSDAYIIHIKRTLLFFSRKVNNDLTSVIVPFLCPYNLFCRHLFLLEHKVYFLEFFNCKVLRIGVLLYSQSCIERSPSKYGVP